MLESHKNEEWFWKPTEGRKNVPPVAGVKTDLPSVTAEAQPCHLSTLNIIKYTQILIA